MAELLQYKCPCCGGGIEFDTASQQMKCPFCGTDFAVDTLLTLSQTEGEKTEDSMDWNAADGTWTEGEEEGLRIYVCQSCAGEVVTDEHTAAASCPFCGNPVIMKGNLSGSLKPDLVIPFALDKKAAEEALRNFCKKKPLLPPAFANENRIREIKGVYVPFWFYSCDAKADLRFRTTRVRTWSDRRYHYTETSHYLVTRRGTLAFDDVPADGSSKMANDLMESLEPFDRSKAVDFHTAYLSGFFADKYDLSSEDCAPRANERIKTSTINTFTSTVQGYSSVRAESVSIALGDNRVRYGLLPVWLLNTVWNGETFPFAMNGQTGKFVGNLFVDRGRYWRYFALIASVATAIAFAISCLL